MKQGSADNNTVQRVIPANIEAEQLLLGAILINNELLNQVNEFLRAEHFLEVLHQKVYTAIEVLVEKGITATPVTLKSMLDKDALFNEVGGSEYLLKLTAKAIVIINCYDHGRIIYDLAVKRNLIGIGEDIVNDAYSSTIETSGAEQLEQAEAKLFDLASFGTNERGFLSLKHPLDQVLASIDRAKKSSNHVTGISTGLNDLNKLLLGFHNSDLIILAGRPAMGKTAFVINFALSACQHLKEKAKEDNSIPPSVGFFSLEMSSSQIATRILSIKTKIDSSRLKSGDVDEEHYNSLMRSAIDLAEDKFFIDDTPALSIGAIRTRARKLKRQHNLAILFIDYLQLIKPIHKTENRVLEITQITQGLKALAKELDIPVIALSQLSRSVEQREDKRPMLSDLRESGSIEQDADIVMFVFREEYYIPAVGTEKYEKWQKEMAEKGKTDTDIQNLAEIIVAKHRNGAIGTVKVHYESQYSIISNHSARK